ncbi:MAG: DUF1570 domain-containing protein [Planctomycetes bacterium]|nr:DUF1570 domain-containing protein [Planctomycetota bacterium]
MPFPLQRTRAVVVLTLAVGLLCLPVGCETLHPERPAEPVARSADPAPPPAPVIPTLPGKYATRRGCCVFYHDFEFSPDDPLLAEPENLPDQVYSELRLPPGNAVVQVFLFDTQARYERYMFDERFGRYKNQPARRAYFFAEPRIGGGEELKIYTWMGDHLRTDLRHELTHALLNGVLKHVPLWLDEGLAGYFELPPANDGVNPQHLDTLRRGPLLPDLARLEKFDQVKQMEKPEYREAWAWVHFMLRSDPAMRKVLLDHLQALRVNPNPGPLLPKLREATSNPDRALADHLAGIEYPQSRSQPK